MSMIHRSIKVFPESYVTGIRDISDPNARVSMAPWIGQ